jgi:hypothetical protein
MAVVMGTNAGFVTSSPSADPAGSTSAQDYRSSALKDTTPDEAVTVTEIGWYADNATEDANWEAAIYTDDGSGNNPDEIVDSDITNDKGTDAGWKKCTGLNIALDANTVYWIAVQCDDTSTDTDTNWSSGSELWDRINNSSALPGTWGTSDTNFTIYIPSIYAVYTTASGGTAMQINIGDDWKSIEAIQINIGDTWKAVEGAQINISDAWKTIF